MENGNRRNLYLVTLSVSLALVTMGVTSAWPTLVLPKFKKKETQVDINLHEISTMLALSPVGFAVGSLATGYTADKFGRRITILASALPMTIGSFLVAFTAKAWLVCVAYFLWGCGTGMISTVVNYYLSEIADKDVRGTLSLITGFMFKFGHLLAMTAGPYLYYENLNQVLAVLPVLFFVVCWWIPETPYFCLKNDNVAGARNSLRTLRGYRNEKILETELQTLQANVKNEMRHSSSVKELFVGKQYRKAIVIAVGLKLTQMMTGAVVLKQYLGLIVTDLNLKIGVELSFVIYGVATFIVSMLSSVLVDRVNRRPLLIFSYIGTGASLAAVGLYFFLQEVIHISPDALATFNFVPYVGINLANVISTLGFNSLIFIIPAEIFPINVKVIAMTCLSLLGAALGTSIALGYQRVKDLGGFTTIFWIFAAFTFGGSVFSYFYVIETKGKDLRDIQAELQGDYYDPVAVNDNVGKDDTITRNDENKESTEMEELNKKTDTL